jgi:hypothetical protein
MVYPRFVDPNPEIRGKASKASACKAQLMQLQRLGAINVETLTWAMSNFLFQAASFRRLVYVSL